MAKEFRRKNKNKDELAAHLKSAGYVSAMTGRPITGFGALAMVTTGKKKTTKVTTVVDSVENYELQIVKTILRSRIPAAHKVACALKLLN